MSIIFCKHPAWQCISVSLGAQFPLPPSARVCVTRGSTSSWKHGSAFFPPLTRCCSSVKCEKSAPLWGQRRHYLNISCTWKCMPRNCKLFNVAFWKIQRESERSLVESVSLARERARDAYNTHTHTHTKVCTLNYPFLPLHLSQSAQKEKLQAAKKPTNDCPPASLRALCAFKWLYIGVLCASVRIKASCTCCFVL